MPFLNSENPAIHEGSEHSWLNLQMDAKLKNITSKCGALYGDESPNLEKKWDILWKLNSVHAIVKEVEMGLSQVNLEKCMDWEFVLEKQRQKDPITVSRHERRGSGHDLAQADAQQLVEEMVQCPFCNTCALSGPPPCTLLDLLDDDFEDDDEDWHWLKCKVCFAYYHKGCMDPSLIDSESQYIIFVRNVFSIYKCKPFVYTAFSLFRVFWTSFIVFRSCRDQCISEGTNMKTLYTF